METVSIRMLQHYLYCPHRWGLIEIDRAWAENAFVTKGNMIHDRAHSGDHYSTKGHRVCTNVDVWHDELGIYGKLDCIEEVKGKLCIVEYKPSAPEFAPYRHEDAMQLFAQKVCAESTFGKTCGTKFYYADKRIKVDVSFEESYSDYYSELVALLAEIRLFITKGTIPPVKKEQHCSGCSMKDLCMPTILKKARSVSVRDRIMKNVKLTNEKTS